MKCSEKVPSGIISGISNLWNCGDAREQHEKAISFPFVQSKCKSELSWQFICILMHIVFHSRDHFRFSKLSWVGGLREMGHFCHTSTNILSYLTKKTESRQLFYLPHSISICQLDYWGDAEDKRQWLTRRREMPHVTEEQTWWNWERVRVHISLTSISSW